MTGKAKHLDVENVIEVFNVMKRRNAKLRVAINDADNAINDYYTPERKIQKVLRILALVSLSLGTILMIFAIYKKNNE